MILLAVLSDEVVSGDDGVTDWQDVAERKVKTASMISSAPSLSREVVLLLPPPPDRYANASARYSDAWNMDD